jgi:hypothetical protein
MGWIILQILICIFIIFVCHNIWIFLRDNFTVKKKKTNNIEMEKYRQLLEEQMMFKKEEQQLEMDLDIFIRENIIENNI